jgi:hypothetical protein
MKGIYMKKTLLILALILTLVASTASAAPTRRRSEPFGLEEAELMAVQPLVNAAAHAAYQKGIVRLSQGSAPEQALVEGVLMRALEERMFPVEIENDTLTLTSAQVRDMAASLFTWPELPALTAPTTPGLAPVEGGLQVGLSQQPDYVGLHVYVAEHDDAGALIIKGDVYRLNGIQGLAEDVPEESIQWLGHMELNLTRAETAPAGYTLSGFAVNEQYQLQGFRQLFDDENGYELTCPDIFPAREEPLKKGEALEMISADGQARLTVTFVPGGLEELKTAWKAETGRPKGSDVWVTEYGALTMQGPLEMRLAMPDEGAGQCVVMTLLKPDDRPCEFGLYWEFLENSFVVYAHAAG